MPGECCTSTSSNTPGSFSFCTPQLTSPIASSAPATTALSLLYRYLSIKGRPPSTSHRLIKPKLAVADVLPCSLFLKIQCTARRRRDYGSSSTQKQPASTPLSSKTDTTRENRQGKSCVPSSLPILPVSCNAHVCDCD